MLEMVMNVIMCEEDIAQHLVHSSALSRVPITVNVIVTVTTPAAAAARTALIFCARKTQLSHNQCSFH